MPHTVPARRRFRHVVRLASVGSAFWPFGLGAQDQPSVPIPIANGNFETPAAVSAALRKPASWFAGGLGYNVWLDTTRAHSGHFSLRSDRTDSEPFSAQSGRFGVGTQAVPPASALGRSVRLSGWIRTERVDSGYAGLWLRVDGPGGQRFAFDNMWRRGVQGTTPWTRYVIELVVDSGATNLVFGVLHAGTGTAWFDSLTLESFGPGQPRAILTPQPGGGSERLVAPPRPAEDMSRLLSDAELAVSDTSPAPTVDSAAADWVRKNARPIRSLGARDFSDLVFLRPLLEGKRIVQLGESGHGVREFNMMKVRLIQYLHEELGYDLLAFESSLFSCDRTGRLMAQITAQQAMSSCIFGVWWTEEVLRLFEYVKATQATPRPLVLTGFDVQSSSVADNARPGFLRLVVAALDSGYAARVHATDSAFRHASDPREYARREREQLIPFYDSLAVWMERHKEPLARALPREPDAPLLALQVARSLSAVVRQMASQGVERTEARDRGMADNLDFLLDVLHPGKKVIVWAHNGHIQHRGFGGSASAMNAPDGRTMGTWVAERRRPELYTIGLYMYRGMAANNSRMIYRVLPAAPGSLEAILHRAPWKYSFVDLSRAGSAPGTAFMRRPITAKEWGLGTVTFVPRDEYDGLIFIDRTWPPVYWSGR